MGARYECAVVVWRSGGEGSGPRERLSLVRLGRLEGALGGPCHIVISHQAPGTCANLASRIWGCGCHLTADPAGNSPSILSNTLLCFIICSHDDC
jgi:hypothetical protein